MIKHTWDYCGVCCDAFVRCGKCGNNCCNGGYGEIDGKPCDACSFAYEMQCSEKPPKFSEEYKAQKVKEFDAVFRDLFSS